MDLTSLSLLVDIVDRGNLSQAARKLKMTRQRQLPPGAAGKSVGVQLLRCTTAHGAHRGRPAPVRPAAAPSATKCWPHAKPSPVWARSCRRAGISVPSGYGQMVMADWLIAFRRQYPRHRA